MNYTVDAVVFDNYWGVVVACTYGTFTELCLFGVLVGLVSATAYLLHKRVQDGRRALVLATCAMALFATLQLATMIQLNVLAFRIFRLAVQGEMATDSTQAAGAVNSFNVMYLMYDSLLFANNMVTDSLFIYRCYIIWNRNIRVVIVPILCLLVSAGLGFLCSYETGHPSNTHVIHVDFRLVLGMVLITNVILMALTAGRIWWIRREITGVLEPSIVRTYNTVIAIILESGAIYCISMIIPVISVSVLDPGQIGVPPSTFRNLLQPSHPVLGIFRAAVPQIMNIAPTLVIVRAVLRCNAANTVASSNRRTSKLGVPTLSVGTPSFHIREPSPSSTELMSIEERNGL